MHKNFDELTIADDYIFCTVMQDENLCKELLAMVLKNKIGTIVKLFKQEPIETHIVSKGIRLDLMVEDDTGKLYDIEMQTTDQKNLAKRMRYYQCAIDNSSLHKGGDYNDLPDTFIIFFCTFDYLAKSKPIYTIKPFCTETQETFTDGTVKIIVNSMAAEQAETGLKEFLLYMNGKSPDTGFTKEIERKINETKANEEKRREYMLIQSFEMDARRAGMQEGMQAGIAQGRNEGFADGSRQNALQNAGNFKRLGVSIDIITQATGLTKEEVEGL